MKASILCCILFINTYAIGCSLPVNHSLHTTATTEGSFLYDMLSDAIVGIAAYPYSRLQQYLLKKQLQNHQYIISKKLAQQPFASHIQLKKYELITTPTDSTYIPSEEQLQNIKEIILQNPLRLLQKNINAEERCYNYSIADNSIGSLYRSKPAAVVAPLINEQIWHAHVSNPLCFLNECTERKCTLTRSCNTTYAREKFESLVAKELAQQATLDTSDLTLVNIGSGALFQDLIILTQFLEKDTTGKDINLVLIDTAYKQYIQAIHNQQQKSQERWTPAQSDYSEYKMHIRHAQFAQLTQWFSQVYPHRKVRVFVHESLDNYLKHAIKNPSLKANIYVGADISKKIYTPVQEYIKVPAPIDQTDKGYNNKLALYKAVSPYPFIKDHGIGLMLLKAKVSPFPDEIEHYCFKLFPQGARPPHNSTLINVELLPLSRRYLVVQESYPSQQSYFSWFKDAYDACNTLF